MDCLVRIFFPAHGGCNHFQQSNQNQYLTCSVLFVLVSVVYNRNKFFCQFRENIYRLQQRQAIFQFVCQSTGGGVVLRLGPGTSHPTPAPPHPAPPPPRTRTGYPTLLSPPSYSQDRVPPPTHPDGNTTDMIQRGRYTSCVFM